MKRIINSEKGMSLILPVVVIGLIILTFSGSIAKMYISLNENNQKVLRGIAAIQIMQDFGVTALRANDLSAAGACPAGTAATGVGAAGFCWPAPQTCVSNPMCNASLGIACAANICFNADGTAGGSAELAIHIQPPQQPTFYARAKKWGYEFLRDILNASGNEAVAQAGRDADLPALVGVLPVNTSVAFNCAVPNAICKRCGVNLNCTRVRVCLLNNLATCTAAATEDNWVIERFGVN